MSTELLEDTNLLGKKKKEKKSLIILIKKKLSIIFNIKINMLIEI